jgi:hypothetical protein
MSKRSKPAAKYRGLSFPVPLLEEIKIYISNKPEYRSVSEFIRESIREKMNEVTITKDKINNVMLNTINKDKKDSIYDINNKFDKIQKDISMIYDMFRAIHEDITKIVPK